MTSLERGTLVRVADTGEFHRVPYFFGRNRADADAQARGAGFATRFFGAAGPTATVVAQSIEAGRQLPQGVVIALRMGLPEGGQTTAPPLLGLNRDAAANRAEASGLKPIFYGPTGYGVVVASQSIRAGQQVARGTYVQLQMHAAVENNPSSQGQPQSHDVQVPTPRFMGRTRSSALTVASRIGATLDITGDDDLLARVVSQTPRPGAVLPQDGHVELTMATPAPLPTQPTAPTTTDRPPDAEVAPPGDTKGAADTVRPTLEQPPSKRLDSQSPQPRSHGGNWLPILGGVGAAAIAAALVLARRRGPPKPEPIVDTAIDTPDKKPETPILPVIYRASVDGGRPTARLAHEPKFAARALAVPREKEGVES